MTRIIDLLVIRLNHFKFIYKYILHYIILIIKLQYRISIIYVSTFLTLEFI